ncbi:MAG: helix-turn-helix domain containing protein [Spirochaetaceae bacterium]|jgi:AcrR family transcriptional regulator|nr:helix-turn-helix domain containing protein [Spirochaetaceae bacterium]
MRADKLRNKVKIINKAKELISETDIESISLEEIASAAEVTRATLYNHFSSKEELLKEMLLPALDFITEDLKNKNENPEKGFSDITSSLYDLYSEHKQTIELASCHTLYNNVEVTNAHHLFLEQFQMLMTSAKPDGYPLGLELSMKLISRIYLPVLMELHSADQLEKGLFDQIIKGALKI